MAYNSKYTGEQVEELLDSIPEALKVKLQTPSLYEGYVNGNSGAITTTSTVNKYTDKIDVTGYDRIVFNSVRLSAESTATVGYAFFNGSDRCLFSKKYFHYGDSIDRQIYVADVPVGATYMRLTVNNSYEDDFWIQGIKDTKTKLIRYNSYGTSSGPKYGKLCTIKVMQDYIGSPLTVKLKRVGSVHDIIATIYFQNTSDYDPNLTNLWVSQGDISLYAVKDTTSTWSIYFPITSEQNRFIEIEDIAYIDAFGFGIEYGSPYDVVDSISPYSESSKLYYTATEIDNKIGDIETLLDNIIG